MAWREAVPAALEGPLRDWLDDTLRGSGGFTSGIRFSLIAERVLLRLNLILPDAEVGVGEEIGPSRRAVARRFLAYGTVVDRLPDIVDAVLYLLPGPSVVVKSPSSPGEPYKVTVMESFALAEGLAEESWASRKRQDLVALLDDSLSVLRVRGDSRGLERRADALSEAAFAESLKVADAASAVGSAAAHLRTAWGCVYALRPDPVRAYVEAIKAVESAAHAVVEPLQTKATLGSMRGHLRAHSDQFSLVIPGPDGKGDIGPLIGCMTLLWEGQTSRHGSSVPTREETFEEAMMAVHLAVLLVQWFASGAVQRL